MYIPCKLIIEIETPVFSTLIGRFSKVFQKFKRTPIMLHFQYSFTKIKTQTFSLILFGAFQEKKFLKDNSTVMQATKTFCLSLFRKRDKFFTVVSKMEKVSIF